MKKEINMRIIHDGTVRDGKAFVSKRARMSTDSSINTDPNGSYTGVPTSGEPLEKPVQDVDDL